MNKTFFILFFCFISFQSFGQKKQLEIKVADQADHIIPFARVTFSSQSSQHKVHIVRTANENGELALGIDTLSGNYLVEVTHVSYDTLKRSINLQDASSPLLLNLGAKLVSLKGVTISAQKDLIYRQRDKVIMNVEDNPSTVGQNIFNILQLAPGVSVFNSSISINGISGARVYINGKPPQLSGAALTTYLNSLRSNDIKSIEIIAHPSAEYDAEGVGGIVNVVLKSSAFLGWSGSIGYDQSFGLGKYPTYNPYFSLNFKKDKLQLSAQYSYSNQKDYLEMTEQRVQAGGGNQSTNTDRVGKYLANNVSFSAIYDINKNQSLGVTLNGNYTNSKELMQSNTLVSYPTESNNVRSIGMFPNRSDISYRNVGINYDWKTDTLNSKFSFAADYTNNKNDAASETNNQSFYFQNQLIGDTVYNFVFPSLSKIFTVEAKYNKIYKSGQELTIGGKFAATSINTDNTYNVFSNNSFQQDDANSFNYHYKEDISAAYVQTAGKLIALDYKAGLRLENSYVQGTLNRQNRDTVNTQKYLNLFPYLYIGKSLDKKGNHNLSLTYNRRLTRPSYAALNPFTYFIDNYTVISGNPYLKPSYVDAIELGYTLHKKYFFSFSYNSIKDQINQVLATDVNTNIVTMIRRNIGSTDRFIGNLSVPVTITKWWTTNNSLVLQHVHVEAPEFDIEKNTFTFQSNHQFKVSKTISLNFSGFYTPRTIYGNTVTDQYSNVTVGVRQRLFKRKLIAGASIYDLFYQNNPHSESYYNNDVIKRYQKFQTRLLTFSLVYNFKIGKSFEAKENDRSNENEKDRLQ